MNGKDEEKGEKGHGRGKEEREEGGGERSRKIMRTGVSSGDAEGDEGELRRGARIVEVKRNVNGRKSGWASMDEEAERH